MNGTSGMKSIFESVEAAPPDAILGLNTKYRAESSPNKVNLGVGAYRTNEGNPLVLPVVQKVEEKFVKDVNNNHEYLPQDGLNKFCKVAEQLILGKENIAINEGRTITVQSLSGTGAIRLCLEFIAKGYMNDQDNNLPFVYVPNPTWPNHQKIVLASGFKPAKEYRYFDKTTGGVDFNGMKEDLLNAKYGSVIILHACAHNPTGADLNKNQWNEVMNIVESNKLIVLFDSAYQGFASGNLDEDAYGIRLFSQNKNLELFISQSFAKNMGLYGERIGSLTVICKNSKYINNIQSQLKTVARTLYSSPPCYGAKIVYEILSNNELFEEWKINLKEMADRILKMRFSLKQALIHNHCPGDWEHITNQIGMFSFTGLSEQQVLFLREKYAIYMTLNGRISMAGLNTDNLNYVADAIKDAVVTHPSS